MYPEVDLGIYLGTTQIDPGVSYPGCCPEATQKLPRTLSRHLVQICYPDASGYNHAQISQAIWASQSPTQIIIPRRKNLGKHHTQMIWVAIWVGSRPGVATIRANSGEIVTS